MTQPTIRLTVNGRIHDVDAAPDTALLYVLRNDLELNGPKYGCGLGECGDLHRADRRRGGALLRDPDRRLRRARHRDARRPRLARSSRSGAGMPSSREQAAQCGYCLNGMIMTTKALLLRNPHPSEAEVLEALRYNLCRCGAHIEIMRAAMRAAGRVAEAQD